MFSKQRIWQYLRQHRVIRVVAGHLIVVSVLGLVLLSSAFGSKLLKTFASSPCSSGDQTYVVASGDTLGNIAARYGTTSQRLASYNGIADPNQIYLNQQICIPNKGMSASVAQGTGNTYPPGQCTWWADHRYHELHGMYVPWTTNANAWQWTARAGDFHWRISHNPSVGAIVDLQPWVQGAAGLGHVAVVERVLANGNVVASNLNWGPNYQQVTNVEFTPGSGVTFISA